MPSCEREDMNFIIFVICYNPYIGLKKRGKRRRKGIVADDEDNKIHVFSLATGHLYERLLRIMMLSVTKRTSVPVKVNT